MQFAAPLPTTPPATTPFGATSPGVTTQGAFPSSPAVSPLSPSSPYPTPTSPSPYPGATVSPYPAPASSAYTQPFGPSAAPAATQTNPFGPGASSVYAPPSSTPTWTNPNPAPYFGPPPQATLDNTVRPPSPGYDPYSPPVAPPGTLMSQDPLLSGPSEPLPFGPMQRLIQEIPLNYYFIPGGGAHGMGVNDIQTGVTFAFPFLAQRFKSPFYVTPGFGVTLFNGPTGQPVPGSVYDAYLNTAWNPVFLPWLGAEFAVSVGVYSDFHKVSTQSVRFPCKGVAVIALSPSWRAKAGVYYIDRARIKLLPAFGLVWNPNSDVEFDFLFPDPMIKRKLNFGSNYCEWWGYVRGEYGGGSWTTDTPFGITRFDYNDIRAMFGVEFNRLQKLRGHFEIGVAFNREVYFPSLPRAALDPALVLGAGVSY